VKANRAFHLIASRGSLAPAFLADEDRVDRIEIVSIDDGEVLLFWQLPPREASRLLRDLKTDLAGMEAIDFIAKWSALSEEGAQPG
jgi:hypothetical protein